MYSEAVRDSWFHVVAGCIYWSEKSFSLCNLSGFELRCNMARRARNTGKSGKTSQRQIVRAVERKNKQEKRQQDKKEAKVSGHFQKAMNCFFERTIQEDRSYVFEMLAQNDAWMPRLAALFRSGAMKQLLTEGMSALKDFRAMDDEPRWRGKCYKLLGLPLTAKMHMVEPWVTFPDKEIADGHVNNNWLDQVLKYLFHINEKTPLPKHEDIRSLKVLRKFAEARISDIGNRFENVDLDYGDQGPLKFYELNTDMTVLRCCFLDQEASLPNMKGGTEWILTNAFDAGCEAVCVADNGVRFSCASFFSAARALSVGKWSYEIAVTPKEPLDTQESDGKSQSAASPAASVGGLALALTLPEPNHQRSV